MRRIFRIVLLALFCVVSKRIAQAACIGTSVNAFGAKGDGVTDDTSAIQSAIDAAAAAGGGSVVFNVARYFSTGTFVVPTGVVLCGAIEGPFDITSEVDPAVTVVAPTLLVTNTTAPFLTLNGVGAGVTDLLFHYPNQVSVTASAPSVDPYTIVASAGGTKVVRSFVTNAYNFLDIESGRVLAQELSLHSQGQAAPAGGQCPPLVVLGSLPHNVPGGLKLKALRSFRLPPGNVTRCPPLPLLEFALLRKLAGQSGESRRSPVSNNAESII